MATVSFADAQELPILATKLYIPPLPRGLVARPRLIGRLNARLWRGDVESCFARRLTLVSAPPGFGKTTLVADWLQRLEAPNGSTCPYTWLSLDDADNEKLLRKLFGSGELNEEDFSEEIFM